MILNILKPRLALNKAYLKVKPNRPEIELFKKNLIILLGKIDEIERENNQLNHIRDFLLDTYYKESNEINTKDNKDLVIHNGKDAKSTVGVIIEAKRPGNKGEMISKDNLNAKAFQELVLYYLRERITKNNLEIKHLIATNIYEWFIFDAQIFEKHFAQNIALVKQFIDFEESRLSGIKTDFFYKEIAKPAIDAITTELSFAYFDIREYEKPLRNASKSDDNVLIALYKLLSPENLLKLPFANDSNSLDKAFYSELLHIIGLTETKDGSKKLIERKKEGERNRNSLIENAIEQLDATDKISWLKNAHQFGADHKEQIYNVALELSITWINRILFLKLLEAQLIKYNKGNTEYSFLNIDKVKNFDDLNSLFFSVLARKPEERNAEMKRLFPAVPYLNSSLFEPTELEQNCFFIGQLKDGELPLLSTSVIKDNVGGKRKGSLTIIEYIFEFLNAYNFASEGSEEIQEDNKRLINASVLGLIFEKINGYKDGSFFTPGFITMYMCRETIRRAVLQKFNEAKGWDCPDLNSLYNKISALAEANKIVNSLKICDPAVGSGHFLVSALNEIIAIKSELGILLDRDGRKLKDYNIEVANDELVVTDEEGKIFEYNPNLKESQRVQSALFHEKQTIIENCLFGVDINPNSVKICRLRLWIELLKNAYYKDDNVQTRLIASLQPDIDKNYTVQTRLIASLQPELETLPNIDINIKCGNSLISRYPLDADIKAALKKSKWTIDSYRNAIMSYRNAKTKDEKRELENLIEIIKNDFETEIWHHDRRLGDKKKLEIQISEKTAVPLFEMSKTEKARWDKEIKKLTDELNKINTALAEIKNNIIYENALEWRFEFPEVLDDDGNFVGFDVVIGNPPYVMIDKTKEEGIFLFKNYKLAEGKPDLFGFFIEQGHNILKNKGYFSFIIPSSLLTIPNYNKIRRFLITDNGLLEIINFWGPVFEEASINSMILSTQKSSQYDQTIVIEDKSERPTASSLQDAVLLKKKILLRYWIEENYQFKTSVNNTEFEIIKKIKLKAIKLSKLCRYTLGMQVYHNTIHDKTIIENRLYHSKENKDSSYFPEVCGTQISKYNFKTNSKEYVSYGEWCYNKPDWIFCTEKRILIREITSPKGLVCCIADNICIPNKSIIIVISNNIILEVLLAILNSHLIGFYINKQTEKGLQRLFPRVSLTSISELPIILPDNLMSEKIIILVNQILALKQSDPTAATSDLEHQIDKLVYELYGLTEEEIKIVEN